MIGNDEQAGNHDQQLFDEEMGKVQPLAPAEKVVAKKSKPPRAAEYLSNRQAYHVPAPKPSTALSVQPTDDPWVFVSDGMSRERLKRLAAGRPAIERTFDLHGMTRDQALGVLEQGFAQAIGECARTLCIIHGRGLHSQGRPILKEAVYHWLRQGAYAHSVLAVIQQPGSGGGACLLLLRRKL